MLEILTKRERLPLILFSTAFIVRLIYLIDTTHTPFFEGHIADAMFHEAWAKRILDGDLFSLTMPGVLYKAPFYPYFIAFGYLVSGESNLVLMFLQVLMAAAGCALLFLIGRRPFGDGPAFLGAMMYTLYFPSVYFSTEMEIPTVATFLTLLAFYLAAEHKKVAAHIGAAALFGLSVTALPSNLLLLPLFLFIVFKSTSDRNRRLRRVALFSAVAVLMILPVTVRNGIAGDRFVPVSANGGINLYIGNNPRYDETVYLQPGYKFEMFYDEPGRVAGANSVAARNDYWYQKTFAFIADHPLQAVSLVFKKVVLYFSNYEIYRNTDMYYAKSGSVFSAVPFVPAAWILALACVGAGIALRRRMAGAIFGLGLLLALPCIVFFVTSRYRLPSVAIWSLFAGFGAVTIVDAFRKRRWAAGIIPTSCALGVAALSYSNLFVVKNPDYRPYLNLGFILEAKGENEQAIESYETALARLEAEAPGDVETASELHARIGNVLITMNRPNAAEERFKEAARLHPDSAAAHAYLGALYASKQERDAAEKAYRKALDINPRDVVALHNLGKLYLEAQDIDKATPLFLRALKIAPEHAGVHRDLAIAYDLQGDTEKMEAASKKAIFFNPKNAAARYNLASMYYRNGRIDDAVRQYETIIEEMPEEAGTAYTQMGVISAKNNDLESAIDHWKKALALDPTNRNAQLNLMKAESMLGR